MNKKKITALVLAGVLTVGVVGATLAWFTSKDEITNIFSTETDLNAGIDIEENFPGSVPDKDGNPVYNKPVMPGVDMTKEAWVESKANYDQFVRARVVKVFKDKHGNPVNYYRPIINSNNQGTTLYEYKNFTINDMKEVKDSDDKLLGYNLTGSVNDPIYQRLDFNKISVDIVNDGKGEAWIGTEDWNDNGINSTSNWFYYNSVLTPHLLQTGEPPISHIVTSPTPGDSKPDGVVLDDKTCHTVELIDKVQLISGTASTDQEPVDTDDNAYMNLRFDVKIESEAVQAAGHTVTADTLGGPVVDAWETLPDDFKSAVVAYFTLAQP